MENKQVQTATKPILDSGYMALIKADQEQNRERASNLPILNEEAKTQIIDACKYSGYMPNPITKDFIRKYILSKMEFPTTLGCLAQAITELNVRITNLYGDAYMFDKAKLEVRLYNLNVRRAHDAFEKANNEFDKEQASIDLEMARLESTNKQKSLNKLELEAMARYKEAMEWKSCVEDFMKEGGWKTLDEVPWDQCRMEDMAAKIQKMGQLASRNSLEMTPSKFNVIDADLNNFNKGLIEGLLSQKGGYEKAVSMGLISPAQDNQKLTEELTGK